MIVQGGDIVLVRSAGVLGKLIRIGTQCLGESRTVVNHVGIVVTHTQMKDAMMVEALTTVVRHELWDMYEGKDVAIYRANNLSRYEISEICRKAESYVGKSYGYLKLVAHFMDWCLLGAYAFRRLTNSDNYPICSWVVAHAFGSVGKHFGVADGAATPDDIWDFVTTSGYYECVHELSPLCAAKGRV